MTPELEAMLSKVPRYILLQPGVDVWREGDCEYIDSEEGFMPIDSNCHGCEIDHDCGRREIPEHVREAMAQLILSDLPYNGVVRPFESWLAGDA